MMNSSALRKPEPEAFDPHENNCAWLVYRYPEHYQLVRGAHGSEDIFISRRGILGHDKHFWVEASEVEKVKQYYEGLHN